MKVELVKKYHSDLYDEDYQTFDFGDLPQRHEFSSEEAAVLCPLVYRQTKLKSAVRKESQYTSKSCNYSLIP